MPSPALKHRLCAVGFMFAVVAKFWLIWNWEIADAHDDPHEYVLQILFPANGGLSYPPGTGLIGQFFQDVGIPYRLGLEAVFLVASALVLRALIGCPWREPVALFLFALTVFNPAVTELFSHLFSDPVWLVATLLGLACFVLAFPGETRFHRSLLAAAALFLGFSTITRSIFAAVLLALVIFTAVGFLFFRSKRRAPGAARTLGVFSLALWTVLLGLGIIYGGTCRYNSIRHGYSGLSYIDSAEYKKFYLCLQSVGDADGPAYYSIDAQRRNLIAQAGPVSEWLVGRMNDNSIYQQIGTERYGLYDIPSGWFHWAAFTATVKDGDYPAAFAIFRSVEEEITTAGQQGRLKVRPILPLPDCRLAILASTFPAGLNHIVEQSVHESGRDSLTPDMQSYTNPEFTTALTRRTVVGSPSRTAIWQDLSVIYSMIYRPALFYLYLATLFIFFAVLTLQWNRIGSFSLSFVARQIFTVFFVVLVHWYALFDASGMPVTARYMIFNQVMLPILIAYYVLEILRLRRHHDVNIECF